jgi:hypothetical protein
LKVDHDEHPCTHAEKQGKGSCHFNGWMDVSFFYLLRNLNFIYWGRAPGTVMI